MPQRLAGIMSILAFVFCLLVGAFGADNTLSTVIYRALVAMFGTFAVAFVIGLMAKKMIDESVSSTNSTGEPAVSARSSVKIGQISEAKSVGRDR